MYIAPRLRAEREAQAGTEPQGPQETGRRLATLDRANRGGAREELRVVLDEYENHPYVSVRIWTRDASGACYPTRKGVSVRVAELLEVSEALREAAQIIDAEPRPQARPQARPAGARPPARREPAADRGDWSKVAPPVDRHAQAGFDETTPADDGPRPPWEG